MMFPCGYKNSIRPGVNGQAKVSTGQLKVSTLSPLTIRPKIIGCDPEGFSMSFGLRPPLASRGAFGHPPSLVQAALQ